MTTITIPATYPGINPYTLEFRIEGTTVSVRRKAEDAWREVHELRGTPIQDDPERILVEINGDRSHGAPVYAIMRRVDWEGKIRGIRG